MSSPFAMCASLTALLSLILQGCCLFPFSSAGTEESTEESTTAEPAPETEEPETNSIEIKAVVFARALNDQWEPVGGAVTEFRADETRVEARVTLEGRPRSGVVEMVWMWRDHTIAQASVDLSDVNGGVLFSFGRDTLLKGAMDAPLLYLGDGNRLVLKHGDVELGSYGFNVVPPEGARPSRFISATLTTRDPRLGNPGPPVTEVQPAETVYVVGRVALGHGSWFNGNFVTEGSDTPIIRELLGVEGGGDEMGFLFPSIPEAGWPPGNHRVELILDDEEVARYEFTVPAAETE